MLQQSGLGLVHGRHVTLERLLDQGCQGFAVGGREFLQTGRRRSAECASKVILAFFSHLVKLPSPVVVQLLFAATTRNFGAVPAVGVV